LRSLVVLAACCACGESDARRSQDTAAADSTALVKPVCLPDSAAQITGAAVGAVRVRARVAEVRNACPVVGDTTLILEGQAQPALLVQVGRDTIIAEVAQDRISRIRVVSSGLATADEIRVGTPLRQLARIPSAELATGEGQHYLIAPIHCGLSFGIEGLPFGERRWTPAAMHAQPDSVRVDVILVVGMCHENGGLRVLWDNKR
jgi:hypothetical protein